MNESWAMVRDLTTCPGYSKTDAKKRAQFQSCLRRRKDTNLELPDPECFQNEVRVEGWGLG